MAKQSPRKLKIFGFFGIPGGPPGGSRGGENGRKWPKMATFHFRVQEKGQKWAKNGPPEADFGPKMGQKWPFSGQKSAQKSTFFAQKIEALLTKMGNLAVKKCEKMRVFWAKKGPNRDFFSKKRQK